MNFGSITARTAECIREGDDLMSATRYAVMMLRYARTNIAPKLRSFPRALRGGWQAA
jgi:hypothetical protein